MTSRYSEVIVCVGSNCGDRKANVADAIEWLRERLQDYRHSPIYATPDCHGGHRVYMNAVCIGKTHMEAAELDTLCKSFELSHGRDATARTEGDVPVDVDVVVYDGNVLRERDFRSEFFRIGYREII